MSRLPWIKVQGWRSANKSSIVNDAATNQIETMKRLRYVWDYIEKDMVMLPVSLTNWAKKNEPRGLG